MAVLAGAALVLDIAPVLAAAMAPVLLWSRARHGSRARRRDELAPWPGGTMRYLGLTAVDKLRDKQCSRLSIIRAAGTNSKLFYIRVNSRKRKIFIQNLQYNGTMMYTQQEKEQVVFEHFGNLFCNTGSISHTLNWEILNINPENLSHLEDVFSADEVKAAINDLPSDKAPGPDGYIGVFYKSAWEIIKHDIMAAVNFFYNQHDQHLKSVNAAHIELHKHKQSSLFFKLDIAKAFDLVRWDYLQEILQRLGFGPRWRAWVTALLNSGSSAASVNGVRE
ncbi:uncharacterized protein [Miscanthus floridulus]|uniref:uncharacterized protein n=1 Tax=Miscanthus floridulus TaxID=154761 RepID=UPI003457AB15